MTNKFKVGDKVINGKGQTGTVISTRNDETYPILCLMEKESGPIPTGFASSGNYWEDFTPSLLDIRKLTKLEQVMK